MPSVNVSLRGEYGIFDPQREPQRHPVTDSGGANSGYCRKVLRLDVSIFDSNIHSVLEKWTLGIRDASIGNHKPH